MASIKTADVVVGVLEEPGVYLHLAGEYRLELVGHVVQAGITSCRAGRSASAGITPISFWRAKVRSRCASQPSSNWPLYLSAHSFGT